MSVEVKILIGALILFGLVVIAIRVHYHEKTKHFKRVLKTIEEEGEQ